MTFHSNKVGDKSGRDGTTSNPQVGSNGVTLGLGKGYGYKQGWDNFEPSGRVTVTNRVTLGLR